METKWNEKKLGFGLMRLPMKDDTIDIPAVCKLVDSFISKSISSLQHKSIP